MQFVVRYPGVESFIVEALYQKDRDSITVLMPDGDIGLMLVEIIGDVAFPLLDDLPACSGNCNKGKHCPDRLEWS